MHTPKLYVFMVAKICKYFICKYDTVHYAVKIKLFAAHTNRCDTQHKFNTYALMPPLINFAIFEM